jgi:cell filamentation protein
VHNDIHSNRQSTERKTLFPKPAARPPVGGAWTDRPALVRRLRIAAAAQVSRLMQKYERAELASYTPCTGMEPGLLTTALARTHGELVLIHPFREGNGRCARLLALLMALQAGLPPLDFTPLTGKGRRRYFAAVQAALGGDYEPLTTCFRAVIRKTQQSWGARRA